MDDSSNAILSYQKCIEHELKCYTPDLHLVYNSHKSMAEAFEKLGQFDKAIEHAEHALDYARQVFEPNTEELVTIQTLLDGLREKPSNLVTEN
ncbi:unnamed protein product [Rotaria sordida]|uniref:Tetratricopeptide repeat protein n=1 Tax=Rotaria sordida TaxID=392033 RepID=A0A819P9K9_9BILA|nr:unnamed protein product [Rotaria sordida]CAF4009446.1 unnamed protein product [Rotaria sordida]